MGLIKELSSKRKELASDESGWIAIAIVGVIAVATLLGTYYITKPIGAGIGDMFVLFGETISLYVVAGVVILGLVFLWLVFGKKS